MFEHSVQPIAITSSDWENGIKFIYVNRAFCNETKYLKENIIGQSPKILQGQESNQKVLSDLKKTLQADQNFIGQSVNYRKDGTPYYVKWSISPLKDSDNKTMAYISFQTVIDKEIKIEHEKLLSSIVNVSNNLILVTNLEGIIVYVNQAFSTKLGYSKEELIGKHTRVLKSGVQNNHFYKKMWKSIIQTGSFSDIFISKKSDGTLFYDKKDISTIKDENGRAIYYVSISSDISDQVQKELELENQAYIDTLTNIFNRKKYEIIIDKKIIEYKQNNKIFSLILIDIDHFKEVNDTYGHDMGDYILKEMSNILQENIDDDHFLFRWGGEEFAILVNYDAKQAYEKAFELKDMIKLNRFQSINITASFGISTIVDDITKKELFKQADQALYSAKSNGRDSVIVYRDEL